MFPESCEYKNKIIHFPINIDYGIKPNNFTRNLFETRKIFGNKVIKNYKIIENRILGKISIDNTIEYDMFLDCNAMEIKPNSILYDCEITEIDEQLILCEKDGIKITILNDILNRSGYSDYTKYFKKKDLINVKILSYINDNGMYITGSLFLFEIPTELYISFYQPELCDMKYDIKPIDIIKIPNNSNEFGPKKNNNFMRQFIGNDDPKKWINTAGKKNAIIEIKDQSNIINQLETLLRKYKSVSIYVSIYNSYLHLKLYFVCEDPNEVKGELSNLTIVKFNDYIKKINEWKINFDIYLKKYNGKYNKYLNEKLNLFLSN